MSGVNKAFDSDNDQQQKAQPETDAAAGLSTIEKENNARENNVAKIKVVVCQLCMYYHLIVLQRMQVMS